MRRSTSNTRIGENQIRYRIQIEDDPSTPGIQADWRLIKLMEQLVQSPDLLTCGYFKPATLRFKHDGERWIVDGEVVSSEEVR